MPLPDCRCVGSYPNWKILGPIVAAARTWAGESPDLHCFDNRPIIDQLRGLYCATLTVSGGGGGGGGATLLASFYIPEIVDSFERSIAAGFTGDGDPDPFQREAAVDVLRDSHYQSGISGSLVILEDEPTECVLVSPGIPDVIPGMLMFDASWTSIPVTVSLLKYQYQIDTDGWVDNGTSLSLNDIAATGGTHALSVRAVSTSGVFGDVETSAPFEVEGSPSGPIYTDDFDSYSNFAQLSAQPNWAAVGGDQIYVFNPSGTAGVAYSAIITSNRLIRRIDSLADDQYAFVTISGTMSGNQGFGPAVRVSNSADSGYFLLWYANDGNLYMVRRTSGSDVVVATVAKAYSSGVKIKIQAVGSGSSTRLTAFEDTGSGFIAIASMEDIDPGGTYFSSGFGGMVGFGETLGSVDGDNTEGGNV